MTSACTKSAPTESAPRAAWLILITGAPAAGKTTLGVQLAARLQVPFLAKDAIKEQLFDTLGWSDRAWSQRLSRASFALLYAWIEAHLRVGAPLVVEANFKPEYDSPRFLALRERYPFALYQIVLRAAPEALQARFAARHAAGARHPGHGDADFGAEFAAQLEGGLYGPLELPGETLALDTTEMQTVDFAAVVETVCRWAAAQSGS